MTICNYDGQCNKRCPRYMKDCDGIKEDLERDTEEDGGD